MKKILVMLLAAVLVLGLFACTPEEEENVLKVAAIETAYGAQMWVDVCKAFEEQTGIKVELTTDKNLEDVISPSMQGGEYPDVIHLATGREAGLTEQFIKGKQLVDLTDVLSMTVPGESKKVSDKISGGFTETALTNPYGDGKTYLAPMFYSPCGLFYNAKLFEAKGWTVPTTWDEMWELGDKAKADGISLFTYPTTGYYDAFTYALIYSIGGADFFNDLTNYKEGAWESANGAKLLEILDKLADYTHPNTPAQANDDDFKKNQLMVMQNKALFMPNGTWITSEMESAETSLENKFAWGMTALPAVTKGGAGYSYCWFEQAWIPSGAKNVDAAKQFIAFLYSDAAAAIFAKAGAIQPINGVSSTLEGENKMFYSIYDNGAKAAMGNFASYKSVAGLGTVREEFFDPINSLVEGSITIEQYKEKVIAASAKMRENLLSE